MPLYPGEGAADPAEEKEDLIPLLRAELEEYGWLLNLIEAQQHAIVQRSPDAVLELNESISVQVKKIQTRREAREQFVRDLAGRLNQPANSTLRALLGSFRAPIRPLLEALIEEVNSLVKRARRRAQQNQMLLARSIEVMQDVLHRLNPEMVTKVYGADGRAFFGIREAGGRCLAKG